MGRGLYGKSERPRRKARFGITPEGREGRMAGPRTSMYNAGAYKAMPRAHAKGSGDTGAYGLRLATRGEGVNPVLLSAE
jgi:hypothetical protein